ncbi:MAG: hypothetical protein NTW86_29910 [Candidatus Sumerlaeota bacterium]|nr:hypothetical protein [Candidatus Sumerlaeota bacterium]
MAKRLMMRKAWWYWAVAALTLAAWWVARSIAHACPDPWIVYGDQNGAPLPNGLVQTAYAAEEPGTQGFTVWNGENGSMQFTVSVDGACNWLALDTLGATVKTDSSSGPQDKRPFTLYYRSSNLSVGEHNTVLHITSLVADPTEVLLDVTLTVVGFRNYGHEPEMRLLMR